MLTEDLAKLKELDQVTYDRIMLGIPIGPRGMYLTYDMGERRAHQYKEAYVSFVTLPRDAQDAWLQWCLQEAIAARGWHQSTSGIDCNGYNWQTYIHIEYCDPIRGEWSDNPAASLLAAYIAALEAQL